MASISRRRSAARTRARQIATNIPRMTKPTMTAPIGAPSPAWGVLGDVPLPIDGAGLTPAVGGAGGAAGGAAAGGANAPPGATPRTLGPPEDWGDGGGRSGIGPPSASVFATSAESLGITGARGGGPRAGIAE